MDELDSRTLFQRIATLSGRQARIALLALTKSKDASYEGITEALILAETYPAGSAGRLPGD